MGANSTHFQAENVQKMGFWRKASGVNALKSSNPGERFLIISCWRFTGISHISFFKARFFQYSSYLFPKVFCAKCGEILTSGYRERCVSAKKLFRIQSHFWLSTHALHLTGFFWLQKKMRIAGFLTWIPFLIYLCNKRLKPSIRCVQLWRKIAHGAGTEQIKRSHMS